MAVNDRLPLDAASLDVVAIGPRVADTSAVAAVLDDLLTDRRSRTSATGGRTTWLELEQPLAASGPVTSCRALKVKGIGSRALKRLPSAYVARPGYPPHRHLGFTADGGFRFVTSQPAPSGGLTLSAARAEFELPERLLSRGVPAIVPVALLAVRGARFRGEPLAVVVSGCPDRDAHRPDAVIQAAGAEPASTAAPFVRKLAGDLGVELDGAWGRQRLALIGEVYARFGRALRRFAEAGCHRYSGASDNLLYSFAHREVLLVDLDSSRLLMQAPGVSAPLEIVRDVMSGMFNLACELIRPDQILLSEHEDMLAVDPYQQFLAGYFSELTVTPEVTASFTAHVAAVWERVRHNGAAIMRDTGDGYGLFRSLRFDTVLIYMALFRLAYRLYLSSGLADQLRPPFDLRRLDQRIAAFAGVDLLARARELSDMPSPP